MSNVCMIPVYSSDSRNAGPHRNRVSLDDTWGFGWILEVVGRLPVGGSVGIGAARGYGVSADTGTGREAVIGAYQASSILRSNFP